MLKTLRDFLVQIVDYVAPRRIDALLVSHLEPVDILRLPPAPRVDGMDWIHPLFHYKNNSVRAIIWELKYKENVSPLPTIGEMLYEEIISLVSDIKMFNAHAEMYLVPIPISIERRRERGYNQSEYIAKALLPYDTNHILTYAPQWLSKPKETLRQSHSQSKQDRMRNLVGCFQADPRVVDTYIILIDDVVTTGSTLSEARRTLLSAGAREVFAFTVAH